MMEADHVRMTFVAECLEGLVFHFDVTVNGRTAGVNCKIRHLGR